MGKEKHDANMLGVYMEVQLLRNLKSLAHRRETSTSEVVREMIERELNQAIQSGEWKPRETPTAEVMGV